MTHDNDRLRELANNIDDAALVVEELQEENPPRAEEQTLDTIQDALERASDATDELFSKDDVEESHPDPAADERKDLT